MPARTRWENCSKRELMDWRLCDLDLRLEGSGLEAPIERLNAELKGRQLRIRPHYWLSEEWFSPDGVPGIAIPFYLAHPRLRELERSECLEVEGGRPAECLQLLRHEAGHVLQHAFRLQRRKKWRALFGSSATPYPDQYRPRPGSREHVLHLPYWYAQSHPDEDFAETFAVWLTPGLDWRRRYEGWPALAKLVYVDELMQQLAGQRPPIQSRARPEPLHRIRTTLREHYARKKQRYQTLASRAYDTELRRFFWEEAEAGRGANEKKRGDAAAAFLRRHRIEIRDRAAHVTGREDFALDAILAAMITRTRALGLRVLTPRKASAAEETIAGFATLLAAHSGASAERRLDWHAL